MVWSRGRGGGERDFVAGVAGAHYAALGRAERLAFGECDYAESSRVVEAMRGVDGGVDRCDGSALPRFGLGVRGDCEVAAVLAVHVRDGCPCLGGGA
jgi:hypothetical protein